MTETPTCTCLSISRDPLCIYHGDIDTSQPALPAGAREPHDADGFAFINPDADPITRVAAFLRIYAARIRCNEYWDVPETMALAYESAARTLDEARDTPPDQTAALWGLADTWDYEAEELYLKRFNDTSACAAFQTAAKQLREALLGGSSGGTG